MKRVIITISIAAAALCLHAEEMFFNPTNVEQLVSNARLVAAGSTNQALIRVTAYSARRVAGASGANVAEVLEQIDRIFSTAPNPAVLRLDYANLHKYLPLTGAAVSAAVRDRFPAMAYRLDKAIAGGSVTTLENLAGQVEHFQFMLSCPNDEQLELFAKNVLKAAPREARRHFRAEGRAITAKDGVDPVVNAVGRVTMALNAPRMADLHAALAEIGIDMPQPEYAVVPVAGSEAAKKLLDDIYIGDVELKPAVRGVLRYMLGTDGYNAFVERYNGGTR